MMRLVRGLQAAAGRAYLWAAERLYHELAWAYEAAAWLVSLGRWSAWRRGALEHVRGERVLEIGNGTGALLVEMARRGWHVVGLERSVAMQRQATHRLRRARVRVPRLLGDARALPVAGGALDAVVSTFPSPYITAPGALEEVRRVLRPANAASGDPGGRLVVVGLYLETRSALLRRTTDLLFGPTPPDVPQRFAEIAARAGLRVTHVSAPRGRVWAPVLVLERDA